MTQASEGPDETRTGPGKEPLGSALGGGVPAVTVIYSELAELRGATVSPSGRLAATWGRATDGQYYVDLQDVGVPPLSVSRISLGDNQPMVVRFSEDETEVVIAALASRRALVWRMPVTDVPRVPDASTAMFDSDGIGGISVSRDSRTVVMRIVGPYDPGASRDNPLHTGMLVLDTMTRNIKVLEAGEEFARVAVTPYGRLIVTETAAHGPVKVFELLDREKLDARQLDEVSEQDFPGIFSSLISLDCGDDVVAAADEACVSLLYPGTPRELYQAGERIRRIAVSTDGRMLAVITVTTISLLDIATGDRLLEWVPESPATRVTFRLDDQVLVTAHEGAIAQLWDISPNVLNWVPSSDEGSGAQQGADRVEWQSDAPARVDLLLRAPLARALATRLRRFEEEGAGESFLLHVDGPWGSGKSSLLNLLKDELREAEKAWLVVDFNAWRQSKLGSPWWALLASLRQAMVKDRKFLGRVWLRSREALARMRASTAPFLLAFVLLAVLASGFFVLLRPARLTLGSGATIAQGAAAIVAAVVTLWTGAQVAQRFLLWDSARGARLYEQSNANPMDGIARHFEWLIKQADGPVAFFIDDLDRCADGYVFELLETVQTLVRASGPDDGTGGSAPVPPRPPAPAFVVAADGAWIRRSFEIARKEFAESLAEPGRPLGYVFLDKLFQLRVPVPQVGALQRQAYLRNLLSGPAAVPEGGPPAADPGQVAAARARVRAAATNAEINAIELSVPPQVHEEIKGDVARQQASSAVTAETEHWLQRFGPLLPPNPRAMKRFINDYSILQTVRTLEGNVVPIGPLALWAVIGTRWPSLADYLRSCPQAIALAGLDATAALDAEEAADTATETHGEVPVDVPAEFRVLLTSPAFKRVITFPDGGPLTAELIARCCGTMLVDPARQGT